MKLWKGNRIDAEWELSNNEIVKRFMASDFFKFRYDNYGNTANALVWFISDKTGLDSSWEWDKEKGSIDGSKDMLKILDLVFKQKEVLP